MSTRLLTIKNTNGKSTSVKLDTDKTLLVVRGELEKREVMSGSDIFLHNDAEILPSDEQDIQLSDLIDASGTIYVGSSLDKGIKADPDMEDYRDLTESQKTDLFNKCQIFRGLIFSKNDGITKSFKDLFSWKLLPSMQTPRINTEELSYYSFSKVTQDLNLITNDKLSVALDTPYVKVDSEYSNEKSKSSSASTVTEYLLAKYVVSKASFDIDTSTLAANDEFVIAVNQAVCSEESDKDKMCNLLHVLNEWGLYIPQRFTLGGALYSTEETKISDFKQSEEEKTAFTASVKASYASVSGGGSYSHSSSEKSESSSSSKYTNIVINQIGGTPGQTKKKDGLAESLRFARYWQIVNVENFYPSLMLLNTSKASGTDPRLLAKCLRLMNNNVYHGAVKQLQPYVNMYNYATSIESLINPF